MSRSIESIESIGHYVTMGGTMSKPWYPGENGPAFVQISSGLCSIGSLRHEPDRRMFKLHRSSPVYGIFVSSPMSRKLLECKLLNGQTTEHPSHFTTK